MNTFSRVINPQLVDSRMKGGHFQVALGRTPQRGPQPPGAAEVDDEHRPLFFQVHAATDWPVLKAVLLGWLTAHLQAAGIDSELGYFTGQTSPKSDKNLIEPARGNVPTFCARLNPDLVEICESGTDCKNLSLGFPREPLSNAVRVVLAPRQSAEEARTNLLAWLVDHLQACGVQADLIL